MQKRSASVAPLGRNVTIEDVGKMAAWLCSDAASAITGEVLYIDSGLHHIAAAPREELQA
jgi:enoyl-[acyl-carrier protein] reductase I